MTVVNRAIRQIVGSASGGLLKRKNVELSGEGLLKANG